jgi:hypothetical protein
VQPKLATMWEYMSKLQSWYDTELIVVHDPTRSVEVQFPD